MKSRFHKFGILLGGGLCFALTLARGGAGAIPEGYTVERYSPLWEHSPFTIASVQQVTQAPGFAEGLAVVAIARIGSEDWVTLFNKQTQARFSVGAKAEDGDQGIRVVSVATDSDPMKTKVMIQKGGETATVGFDKSLLALTQTPPPPPSASTQPASANAAPDAAPPANSLPPPVRRQRRLPPIPSTSPAPVMITDPNAAPPQ